MIHIKLDKKAKDVISKTADLGSGSIVVNELPQVGEVHTVYELHTTIPSKFNYVPRKNLMGFRYVFENEEAFRDFIRNVASHYNNQSNFYCYCLEEDELLEVYYSSGSPSWTILDNDEENIIIYNDERLCICKAMIDKNTALLLNGKQVPIGDSDGILYRPIFLHQVKSMILCDKYKKVMILPVMSNTLPTCVDGTPDMVLPNGEYSWESLDGSSGIVQWVTNDGSIKLALPYVDGKYSYDSNEECFYDSKTGEYYTGEFKWVDIEDFNFKDYVDYETYDTIPLSEGEMDKPFIFDPSEKLIISYWIYKNGEWINVDDIGKPNTITIPVASFAGPVDGSGPGLIKLSKVHFYLDNKELYLVPVQSLPPNTEDLGYLVVPLSDKSDVSYSLHIVFDNDVLFGSGGNINIQPLLDGDRKELQLTDGILEYDFDICVCTMNIVSGR